jgi:hypothetical protein
VTTDSLKRVARTFIIAFLGIFLPGALGFLHGLTEWANSQGQTPFPNMHSLAFVLVAAIVAGVIALLNFVVVWLEDATGHGLLRNVDPEPIDGAEVAVEVHDEEPHEPLEDPQEPEEPAADPAVEEPDDDADVDPEDRVDLTDDDHAGD